MAGSVSGGCVEGAVVEAALEVLGNGTPQLLEFGVADELAWNVGLACGGNITVWVQPLENGTYYRNLRMANLDGVSAVTGTLVDGTRAGENSLFSEDQSLSTGSEDLLRRVERLSSEVLDAGEPRVDDTPEGRLFVMPYPPPRRLIIIGGVHTAIPLVDLAHTLDFQVTVVDARSAFASKERFPHSDDLLVEWPDDALKKLRPDRNTAIVVLTHDTKFDEPALSEAMKSEAGYIGAIGSRKTSADRLDRLRQLGFTDDQLSRIHGPVGLDLGGRTPSETALAILAEIIAEFHHTKGMQLSLS